MPAFKLTKHLIIEKKLNSNLFENLKEKANSDVFYKELSSLLEAENAREQIDILKKVVGEITKQCRSKKQTEDRVTNPIQFLVHLFFVCATKNPLKRVLISTFQGFPTDIQDGIVHPAVIENLIGLFHHPIREKQNFSCSIKFEDSYDLRHNVDTISSLLENFPLGEECVREKCLEALDYLGQLQHCFYKLYGPQLSPVQQNEMMHHCLETVKLANRICQRSLVVMETKLQDKTTMSWFETVAANLLKTDILILQKDEFLIDCKTTSGMNICLMMKYCSVEERFLDIFLKTVFKHVDWFSESCDKIKLPDWLLSLNFNQLSKGSLSDSSYLCLCYGILAMVTMETLLQMHNNRCILLDILMKEFLDLSKGCSDVGSKLLAAKSICFLTQRLRTYLQKSGKEAINRRLLPRLLGESEAMTQILEFVWTSWEDSVDAIRFTVKDIFENVVMIHLTTSDTGKPADDLFLHKLTTSILNDVSWSCKGKYGCLSTLVGHLGSARMLQLHPGIAQEVLQQLQEQTLSCYASDLYENLLNNHMTQLHEMSVSNSQSDDRKVSTSQSYDGKVTNSQSDDGKVCSGQSDWFIYWVEPVLDVLCGAHKLQKKHVIEYVLPRLLKTGQQTLYHMINTLTTRLVHKHNVIQAGETGINMENVAEQSGAQLGALIMCLRRARVMGQLQHKTDTPKVSRRKKSKGAQTGAKKQEVDINQSNTKDLEPIGKADQSNEGKVKPNETIGQEKSGLPTDQSNDRKSSHITNINQSELWYGLVDVELLRQALICKDEQIRLDAFALLCENQKTTETISCLETDLIQMFIPQNLNNQNPSFRQYLLSHLKKFLGRMQESSQTLKRQVQKSLEAGICLHRYKVFQCWLTRQMFHGLYPGAVFARRTTCLGALTILMNNDNHKKLGPPTEHEFTFYSEVRPCDVHALVFCLTDTFEDNKIEASSILITCSKALNGVMNEERCLKLTKIALKLSQSTRPQDSTTAAYLFQVLLHQPSIYSILQKHVTSPTECTSLVDNAADEIKAMEHQNEADNEKVARNEHETKNRTEAGNNHNANCVVKDNKLNKKNDETKNEKKHVNQEKGVSNDDLGRSYMLLWLLMRNLEDQLGVAKSSLIVASANRPMYPTMQCMRFCLSNVDFRKIPSESVPQWSSFLGRLISLCLGVSEVVSPVVHNCSPEGNVPIDSVSGMDSNILPNTDDLGQGQPKVNPHDDVKVTESHETVMLMPEYLVVCCWRCIKEISLILGQLTSDVTIATSDVTIATAVIATQGHAEGRIDKDTTSTKDDGVVGSLTTTGLITYEQILEIGTYFTSQLLDSKHRGAFELAYTGFVKVTEMLWKSSISELHCLPKQWLASVVEDIKSGDPGSRLCATRRSAGVPFYVQALVSTEPTSTGRSCFKDTIQILLKLAFDDTLDTVDTCNAKVHALNILRAMYKDSRLKDDVTPYIADGLKVSIMGFQSPLWAVRNSATLLMSTMMVRIFGVKRSKDETTFSRKNCQTGRTFFHNYPSLYQFLLDQITMATVNITNELHPGLYPILMVLGRLFPSAMEGTDTSLNLAAFIPYIIKCSSSPVLKTRVMAAKALQPLVDNNHVTSVFTELLSWLPWQPEAVLRQNLIHGVLLQLKQLLRSVDQLSAIVQCQLSAMVCNMWSVRLEILVNRKNPCVITRKEALEITATILSQFGKDTKIFETFIGILLQETSEGMKEIYDKSTPGLSEFLTCICRLSIEMFLNNQPENQAIIHQYLNRQKEDDNSKDEPVTIDVNDIETNLIENMILQHLNSDEYDVRRTVLNKMQEICNPVKNTGSMHLTDTDLEMSKREITLAVSTSAAKGVYSCLTESDKIYGTLIKMIDLETNVECQVELFRLLAKYPSNEACERDRGVLGTQYPITGILERLLDRIESQASSENEVVTAAIISYTSTLIPSICSCLCGNQSSELQTTQNPKNDTKDAPTTQMSKNDQNKSNDTHNLVNRACYSENGDTNVKLLHRWIVVIEKQCDTEASPDLYLACAQALHANCDMLLCQGLELDSQFGEEMVVIKQMTYKCVLDLLQADDLEVKDVISDIASVCMKQQLKVNVHPYVASLILMDNWIRTEHVDNTDKLTESLLKFIFHNRQDDDMDQEERLFDRGETNTYWDQIDFIQLMDGMLMRYATNQHGDGEHVTFNWDILNASFTGMKSKILDHGSTSLHAKLIKEVNKAINGFLTDDNNILAFEDLSLDKMFFDISAYQQTTTTLYQTLLVVKYSALLSNNKLCQTASVYMLEHLLQCLQTNCMCPLIFDKVQSVCEIVKTI